MLEFKPHVLIIKKNDIDGFEPYEKPKLKNYQMSTAALSLIIIAAAAANIRVFNKAFL